MTIKKLMSEREALIVWKYSRGLTADETTRLEFLQAEARRLCPRVSPEAKARAESISDRLDARQARREARRKSPDVDRVMALVWDLVRSGPNFDGRANDVERAVVAAFDSVVAAERERCIAVVMQELGSNGQAKAIEMKIRAEKDML